MDVPTQQVGSLKFAETDFDLVDDALNAFLDNGIKFADNSVTIPCRALDHHMQVVRLRLSNPSFLGEGVLLEDLQKEFAEIWEYLNVGILLEPTTGTYMCTRYAILKVASRAQQFEHLTHLIS